MIDNNSKLNKSENKTTVKCKKIGNYVLGKLFHNLFSKDNWQRHIRKSKDRYSSSHSTESCNQNIR